MATQITWHIDANIESQIANQVNPPIVQSPWPWTQAPA
jgi:hypothetical protein